MEIAHSNKENMTGSYPLKDKTNKSTKKPLMTTVNGKKSTPKELPSKEKKMVPPQKPQKTNTAVIVSEISHIIEEYLWNSINAQKTGDSIAVAQEIVKLIQKKKVKLTQKTIDSAKQENKPNEEKQDTLIKSLAAENKEELQAFTETRLSPKSSIELQEKVQELENVLAQVMEENRRLHQTILELSLADEH